MPSHATCVVACRVNLIVSYEFNSTSACPECVFAELPAPRATKTSVKGDNAKSDFCE